MMIPKAVTPVQQVLTSSVTQSSQTVTSVPPSLHHVTVVTAFIDIGTFGKGSPNNKRDHRVYMRWSKAYSRIISPIVLYTNSDNFARHFLAVRKELMNMTKVVHTNLTSDVWAFGLKRQVAAIYSGGYPKHWPNTVYPDYTLVTHAKFDFALDTISKGFFPSQDVAWMDIGYLRDIANNATIFYTVVPPAKFDSRKVLFGQVQKPNFLTPWKKILRQNKNWVAGGFFLATRDVMKTFVEQYRRSVTLFLHLKESQVEQQILYAMYTEQGRAIVHPTVEIQAQAGDWFTIGFKCLRALHNFSDNNPTRATALVAT